MAPTFSTRPDVLLHIGTGKTGTTSIQHLLNVNRAELVRRGILYPRSPGRTRHLKWGLSFRSEAELDEMPAWHTLRAQSPVRFRRRFHRRLLEEIEEARPSRVVFSDEALYTLPDAALGRLSEFLTAHFGPVHVIAYLRRQDDHLVSYYQQQVKVGETRRLAQFAADPGYPYDYEQRLGDLCAVLRPSSVTVRRFERSRFPGGRLEADFLRAAGIDSDGLDIGQVARNESLAATSVEFLRLYNLHQVEHAGARVGVMDHRDLVARLAEHDSGAQLSLPEAVLDEFMARWESSNQAVATSYFGEPALFAEPRRRGAVQELQELGAAELERLMGVAELPEDVRDRLRRIAERSGAPRVTSGSSPSHPLA